MAWGRAAVRSGPGRDRREGLEAVGQPAQGDRGPAAERSVRGYLEVVADRGVGPGGVGEVAGLLEGQVAGDVVEHGESLLSAILLR